MANPVGSYIWYELMTKDADAAKAFYDSVIGWRIDERPAGQDMDYRMINTADGQFAGGVLGMDAGMIAGGAQPMWIGYHYVPDVDAALADIVADGGTAFMPATDLAGVGRFAMLADPQDVPFYLMTPAPPPGQADATSTVFAEAAPGRVGWNELSSPDLAASKTFYAKHFGFEFNEVMPMGPMGDYCFIDHHGTRLGAIMPRQDDAQPARWLFYFNVASIAAAKAAAEAGGGTILVGPMEVPGPQWIFVAIDPEGVGFGCVGPKGD